MSAARKLRRARRRSAPDGAALAVAVAKEIGPLAARFRLLILIERLESGTFEVRTVDRVTGELRCWGCGDFLNAAVAGTSEFGQPSDRLGCLIRACDTCVPPETRTVPA